MRFLQGTPEAALNTPEKVVLTESIARKYFGGTNVLGRTIQGGSGFGEFVVSGVIEDVPPNSHMVFDLLGSARNIDYLQSAFEQNNWTSPWLHTYVKLHEGVTQEAFDAQLDHMMETTALASILTSLGMPEATYRSSGHRFRFFSQPLHTIHLRSSLDVELQPNGNITYVYLLAVVVLFILLISCINFVNRATARSTERA
jgi:putative ABC transport system permease protein